MRTLTIALLLFAASAVNCQVNPGVTQTVPPGFLDSLASFRAQTNALSAALAELQLQAVKLEKGEVVFNGTEWRKAVYQSWVTPSCIVMPAAVYSVESITYDFVVTECKQDSIIFRRRKDGTPNLRVTWLGAKL